MRAAVSTCMEMLEVGGATLVIGVQRPRTVFGRIRMDRGKAAAGIYSSAQI